MSNLIIEKLLAKSQRTDIPPFHPGDTVRVHVKIKEGDKERVQVFEGVVIKRDNGPQASFTVRKISFGQGVERIFPIHSSDRQGRAVALVKGSPSPSVLSSRTPRQSCPFARCREELVRLPIQVLLVLKGHGFTGHKTPSKIAPSEAAEEAVKWFCLKRHDFTGR